MKEFDVIRYFLSNRTLWLDSETVGRNIDPSSADPKAVAALARREEKILAASDGQRYRYPAFQFDPSGRPYPDTAALVRELPRERDGTLGWDAVLWVLAPDSKFGGRSPAEVFALQPEHVIREARLRREGSRDF